MISADLLREARLRAGITQAELGRRVGRSASQIARWERGDVKPPLETLRELIRVSNAEVRIFPLVLQGAGEPVPFLPEILDELDGITWETRKVPYEFQLGANEMLVITRA